MKYAPIAILILCTAFSCEEDPTEIDCSRTLCTLDLRWVGAALENADGDPAGLTTYYVVTTQDDDTVVNATPSDTRDKLFFGSVGIIPDHGIPLGSSQVELRFTGYFHDQLVADELFEVSHDCCHISKDSGPEKIVIDIACSDDVACTKELRTETANIRYVNGDPIHLDKVRTFITASGEVLREESFDAQTTPETYVIINDSNLDDIALSGTEVTFEGIVDGKVVVSRDFVVTHDCCHIMIVGNDLTNFFVP